LLKPAAQPPIECPTPIDRVDQGRTTELAEGGAPDATLMAVPGHLSRDIVDHYGHVRMAAKREAIDELFGGLVSLPEHVAAPASDKLH
jgi:hypothetical protein